MEVQFEKRSWPCLMTVASQTRQEEQTQEVRLGENMPDIGRVLGTWGQFLLRGKEWRSTGMTVSGGVMVWVLYAPEDGSEPQSVESWIPFQLKWEFPETRHDGVMLIAPQLAMVDARSVSARKLMVRATVSCYGQAMEPDAVDVYTPGKLPEDVHLHKTSYPVSLPREAGEKAFSLDETITLPVDTGRLISFRVSPQIQDTNVVAGKAVFRGTAHCHLLFETGSGRLETHDHPFQFSQFADLDRSYETETHVRVIPAVTNLEMDLEEGNRVHIQCGLLGQFCVSDRSMLEVAEDAYSNRRPVTVQQEILMLPAELEESVHKLQLVANAELESADVIEGGLFCPQPRLERSPDQALVEQEGTFQLLCQTPAGLRGIAARAKDQLILPADGNASLRVYGMPTGQVHTAADLGGIRMDGEVDIHCITVTDQGIPMITGLTLGEPTKPDPDRPSMILRRSGGKSLWDLAKASGSAVEDIMQINQLQGEPEEDRLLLIPVQ